MADNTLTALFPALPFVVGGERLPLRPVVLSELPVVRRISEAYNLLVATGGEVLDADAWEDFLSLLAAAAGKPVVWLESLEEAEFTKLVCLVLALNKDLWNSENPSPEAEEMSWAEIFQLMVEFGHPFTEVLGYTMAQTRAFLAQGIKRDREAFAQRIQASAFAMADGKSVKNAVEDLRRGR